LEFGDIVGPKQFRVSFTAKVFLQTTTEKYDFDLYKGSFMGKNGIYSPDFQEKKFHIARVL
jgi:hypothetical protein